VNLLYQTPIKSKAAAKKGQRSCVFISNTKNNPVHERTIQLQIPGALEVVAHA
jgi:hypothetical protein